MQFLLRGLLAWDLTERESGLGVVYLAFGVGFLFALRWEVCWRTDGRSAP